MVRELMNDDQLVQALARGLEGTLANPEDVPEPVILRGEDQYAPLPDSDVQSFEESVRRIIPIEDDYTLCCNLDDTVATYNLRKKPEDPRYEVVSINPDRIDPKGGLIEYLRSLDLKPTDVVVVDLNLKGYQTKERRVIYTGHDIYEAIDNAVGEDIANVKVGKPTRGLEVLAEVTHICATSLLSEIQDPSGRPNPRLGLLKHIKLYGMEKARGESGAVVSYGDGVLYFIGEIDKNKQNPNAPKMFLPLND